jgi:hypothetical protein
MQLEKTFDVVAQNLANKIGFAHIPWWSLTTTVLYIYAALTILVCFERPDFVNLTIVTAAIQMILSPKKIKRWSFRYLLYAVALTMIYDLFWLVTFADVRINDNIRNGMKK